LKKAFQTIVYGGCGLLVGYLDDHIAASEAVRVAFALFDKISRPFG
jgi:hypothetical protein